MYSFLFTSDTNAFDFVQESPTKDTNNYPP